MSNIEDFVSQYTGEQVDEAVGAIQSHIADRTNPHGVTKSQIGLGNVDNTPDAEKHVAMADEAGYANTAGAAQTAGVAESLTPTLLATLVTQAQLDQLVCDVEEDGLYYVDSAGYIGVAIDNGGLHAINIPTFNVY